MRVRELRMGYVIQAVLSGASTWNIWADYDSIPHSQGRYDHTIELLEPLGISDTLRQDCKWLSWTVFILSE